MNEKRLGIGSYALVGSMLFGLFFGAGNLIFPVELGYEARSSTLLASLGFLSTAIGLPFLGIVAIGITKSDGLLDLSSRVHPFYGFFLTIVLYLTIGPLFAIPRTATVSFEIGVSSYVSASSLSWVLLAFSTVFFAFVVYFSLKASKILFWVGKILNPLFLFFLAILLIAVFTNPMGEVSHSGASGDYATNPFLAGFLKGYHTMDALASLAFGIIVVDAIRKLGVTSPKSVAIDTIKSGFLSMLLMGAIYLALAYLGATSAQNFVGLGNGGVILSQVAQYYFGTFGAVLLALIVIIACMKTAIGLICACSETFIQLFPNSLSYKTYALIFSAISFVIANLGLKKIISLSIPVLMFLYPLIISLIFLSLLSPLYKNSRFVKQVTTLFVLLPAIYDGLKSAPLAVQEIGFIDSFIKFCDGFFPLGEHGLAWLLPAVIGFVLSWAISLFIKERES